METNLRPDCLNFAEKLVAALRSRLLTNFNVPKKVYLFSIEDTFKAFKTSLIDIVQDMQKDASTVDGHMTQWRNIVHIKRECTSSTIEFWNAVSNIIIISTTFQGGNEPIFS